MTCRRNHDDDRLIVSVFQAQWCHNEMSEQIPSLLVDTECMSQLCVVQSSTC